MSRTNTKPKPAVRCAVYTRKSSEEGLEQEFNSLDAQRESAEAFIRSQQHEGWHLLPERYDDGGFTGGNTDRPALQRLLEDVKAGKVDAVVVYKVDRLSRSLLDFTKLMEIFDKHHVSFVSVTQQFNTATSMGRLVLNVLLSFAQFEREIISERTRDKIAAARRKGKWAGGMPLLGYDVDWATKKLVVNDAEADQVRAIFALYLQRRSLLSVVKELQRRGWVNKCWQTRKGRARGGRPFTTSTLHRLLTSPVYAGFVRHKTEVHPGEHTSIVKQAVWDRVQARLRAQGPNRNPPGPNGSGALLRGLLRCGPCDRAMTPTQTMRGTRRYRYYVCCGAVQRGREQCPSKSVPAGEIERLVVEQVRRALRTDGPLAHVASTRVPAEEVAWEALPPRERDRLVRRLVERAVYDGSQGKLAITFRSCERST
jgi:site-specific DNA recombinase